MQDQTSKFNQFASAFFKTAREKNLRLTPDQTMRITYGLSLMRHRYQTDHFHRIRNGELLAINFNKRVRL